MTATLEIPEVSKAGAEAVPAWKRDGGPRTEAGRMASRRDAMTHGLRAKVLIPEDLVANVATRTAELAARFERACPYETWLVGERGKAIAKLERCAEMTTKRNDCPAGSRFRAPDR